MINQSVTVINKSGKVVSTSKHIVSVWKEAKAAYRARKAEIKSTREADYREKEVRKALENTSLSEEHLPRRSRDDYHHHSSSRSHVSRSKTTSRRKGSHPRLERSATDSGFVNDVAYEHPYQPPTFAAPDRGLLRRSTEPPRPRSSSSDSYDEDLAYGTLPPPLPVRPTQDVVELREKMSKVNQLLDEANCLQYSATAVIEHLQKNPEALAAVGLALGEVATLVKTLGPGALGSLKIAFPAVVALLASPQFLIAGGLAVGVTVVMLGGYKIVKKIREKQNSEEDDEMLELRELEGDLSRIENWRRGVADSGLEGDNASSVEGEFITPIASRRLMEEGVLHPSQVRRTKSEKSHRRRKDDESEGGRSRSSKHKHRSGRHDDDNRSTRSGSSSKDGKSKKKSVGGLKMLFSKKKTLALA